MSVCISFSEKSSHTEYYRFAYVDFETPEAKAKAVAMSEKNLDGRRLLIKDGMLSNSAHEILMLTGL